MTERSATGGVKALQRAFAKSEPGDIIVYHTGRVLSGGSAPFAYYLYSIGMVTLVQRRAKGLNGLFDYLAIRTKLPHDPKMKFPENYQRPPAV